MPLLPAFRFQHRYPDSRLDPGVTLPVTLTTNEKQVELVAKVDPGAEFCLFRRDIGEELALEIEAGPEIRFGTLGGLVSAYGHLVTIETFGIKFDSYVYFASSDAVSRNLLGRNGWLDRVRLAIVHHDRELFLSPYEG